MKKKIKNTVVGNIANNPRYDRVYNARNGMDAKAIKDAENNTLYGSTQVTLDNLSTRLSEIYGSRYGMRKTSSGRWRERDEPNDEIQLKQSDAINKLLQRRKQAAGRDRLKSQNKVPTRASTGKKLFEDFVRDMWEATGNTKQQNIDDADMRNIFNAANRLSYEQWIWFVNDEYSSRI